MPRSEMLMVFCYDIKQASRRRKVAATLEEEAVRVQKSVFEARMHEKQADRLATYAAQYLDDGDSLRVYAIGEDGRKRSFTYGGAPIAEKQDYWLL